jgi:peroxidase
MNVWARWVRRSPPLTHSRRRLYLQLLEERSAPTSAVEWITGAGNNLAHAAWGSAGSDLIRIAPSAYADGISAPAGATRPSARDISNALSDQTDPANPTQDLDMPNSKGLSDYIYVFGQFLDHDLDLTTTNSGQAFDIPTTQAGDPFNPPGSMPFTRSTYDPTTGTSTANPRQQINSVTSFMDGSQIYGSTTATADALRTHVGGKLKTSTGNLLPINNSVTFPNGTLAMANDAGIVSESQLFVAGDVRANENIELSAITTVFVREHNRIAAQLQAEHPTWTDEQLYQGARSQVIAELQIITYNEWLPALLGPNALPKYTGYKPNVNASISNEFSTAMFRFAHSQLDNGVDRLNNDGTDSAAGDVDLAEAFFNPTLINAAGVTDPFSGKVSTGVDEILKGAASGDAQEVDLAAVRDIRNLLFGPPGAGGSDLIARDIQRGRDHGLTDYNSMRVAYGLPAVTSFAQITKDTAVQAKLQQLYGSVNNIDVFVGALAEDHVAGADVGPLTKAVLVDQFTRLRDGDRFFYLNQFSGKELNNLLANTSLTKIIERNSGVTNLQSNIFYFQSSISGTVTAVAAAAGRPARGHAPAPIKGVAGITVQLMNDEGTVVATSITDSQGRYRFDDLNGINGTGDYSVHVVVPPDDTETSPDPVSVLISRGDVNATVNFSLTISGSNSGHGSDSSWTDPFDPGSDPIFHSGPGRHG